MRKLFSSVLFIVFVQFCFGSVPEIKTYDNQKDLIDGHLERISIDSDGVISLAPAAKEIFNSTRLLTWDIVADREGNLFVATGDGAKIYHVSADGKADIIAQWEDAEVYSLALDPGGQLYAATSPDGKIYRLQQKNAPTLIADLDVKYIWDMKFDSKGTCYAATGDSGAIYTINEKGEVSLFYQSDETHIRCLAWYNSNQLLAGSYPNGYVYRISNKGQAFILYDSEYQEIHQICVSKNGTIYAAGLAKQAPSKLPGKKGEPGRRSKTRSDGAAIITIPSKPATRSDITANGVIKIQRNGVIKNIWNQDDDQVQSIALTDDDNLLIGTGDKGRLYRISPREQTAFLTRFEASQVVAILKTRGNKFWVATSNLGKVFQLKQGFAKKGIYRSKVFDAKTTTRWGSIQWDQELPGNCKIKVWSRTGNTAEPNSTWSVWKPLQNGEVIKNPAARFIQWKAELTSARASVTPQIKNIKISYLQQNLPPEILSVAIHALERQARLPVSSSQVPSSLSMMVTGQEIGESRRQLPQPTARRQVRNGYRKVSWKARDENKDHLTFDLYFQGKNENNWWQLKKESTRSSYTWDTKMMPDGYYRIKVIGNDSKSNPINTAKQAEKISDWFIVDNTDPKVEQAAVQRLSNDSLAVSFRVTDELSRIKQVQISYDVQKWLLVYPQDLICDSKKEAFKFNIKFNRDQFKSIIIKATDQAENVGYGRINTEE